MNLILEWGNFQRYWISHFALETFHASKNAGAGRKRSLRASLQKFAYLNPPLVEDKLQIDEKEK